MATFPDLRAGLLSALLGAAGVLMAAVSAERWLPACRPGEFDTEACLELQSHPFDYIIPTQPWVSVGQAAALQAVALLLLAVSVPLLYPILCAQSGRLLTVLGAAVALSGVLIAATVWVSGTEAEVTTVPGLPLALLVWILGWLSVLVTATTASVKAQRPGSGWRLTLVALLLAASPLGQFFLTPLFVRYVSHDTTPWPEAVSGAFLVAAALVVWPASRGSSHDHEPLEVVFER